LTLESDTEGIEFPLIVLELKGGIIIEVKLRILFSNIAAPKISL
jgi:hypothetical protein